VTLKVTDNEGCSTESVYTGQTASCIGNPLGVVTFPIKVLNPTGPKLQVSGRGHQGLRRVVVRARCPQVACSIKAQGLVATSTIESGRKVRKLRRIRRDSKASPGRGWRRLVLRLPGSTRRAAERAILSGGSAKARIAVNARDRQNEVTVETKAVTLGF
jgi:hypothetical protein